MLAQRLTPHFLSTALQIAEQRREMRDIIASSVFRGEAGSAGFESSMHGLGSSGFSGGGASPIGQQPGTPKTMGRGF